MQSTTSLEDRQSRRSAFTSSRQLSIRSTCSNIPDSRFICNICYEPVDEPVVTQCGHLYCWKCLFTHLEPGMTAAERAGLTGLPVLSMNTLTHDPNKRICPTCRSPCSVKSIVPIYVRNETRTQPAVERNAATNRENELLNEEIEVNHGGPPHNPGEEDDWLALSEDEDDNPPETTGLRYRPRFRSTDSQIPPDYQAGRPNQVVPRRPRAHSPVRSSSSPPPAANGPAEGDSAVPVNDAAFYSPHSSPQRNTHVASSPGATVGQHQVSLSNGLFPLMQVAHGVYLNRVQNSNSDVLMPAFTRQDTPGHYIPVPAWNRLQDMHQQTMAGDSDTNFLRLLLLLLGSSVILCLLLI